MKKILDQTFKKKEENRKILASFPYEKKVEIVGQLQRIHAEIKSKVDPRQIQAARLSKKS